MHCYQFREMADSYVDPETSANTNREFAYHLDNCPVCREEMAARREFRIRLRETWTKAPENQMRPEFADRLRGQLHSLSLSKASTNTSSVKNHPRSLNLQRRWLLTVAASLILAIAIGFVLSRVMRIKNKSDYESGVMPNLVKTELAKSAVGDHRDCAIQFRLAERSTNLDEAALKYDHAYIDLVKSVTSGEMLPGVEFVKAHSCIFQQRRFAHLIFKYHGQLVSLLVTDNDADPGKLPTVPASGQPNVIACSSFDGYRVSCFQTARHAVFVVSDLADGENLTLARAFESSVVEHLTRSEEPASF